jgi:carboxymethylenebutenolidase
MHQKIIDLYDRYTHEPLDRRVFLTRLAELTGSITAALALVPLLEANQARAAMIPADDQRLEAGHLTYPGTAGDIKAYMARPKGGSKLPAVIVIHENRGLNAHIEDVARYVALQRAAYLLLAAGLSGRIGSPPGRSGGGVLRKMMEIC